MTSDQSVAGRDEASAKFDLLRVQLENAVQRPAVTAIVSSGTGDGEQVAARGLAASLARAGYSTLLIDASLSADSQLKMGSGLTFDEIGLLQTTPEPKAGIVAVLTLGDPNLQRTTSQREVASVFATLRAKFDYVVISAEYGASKAFVTSLFTAADAVCVSIKKGRREGPNDVRLAAALETIGARFLGIIALDSSVIKDSLNATAPDKVDSRRGHSAPIEKERKRREHVEPAIS